MQRYYVRHNGHNWFVKDEQYFRQQGGTEQEWGRAWTPIQATDAEHARYLAQNTFGDKNPPTSPTAADAMAYALVVDVAKGDDEKLVKTFAPILKPEHVLADEILLELKNAQEKFPGKNVTFAALVEEVGELATALFEESRANLRKEAVQVAVMAMRMVLDGDHCYDAWREEKGLDPLTLQGVSE